MCSHLTHEVHYIRGLWLQCQCHGVPLIRATSCVACSSRTRMGFLWGKAREGCKEARGERGGGWYRNGLRMCVWLRERERERKQAPKAWHGFERHSGGSVLHPYNADIAPTQPLHTHTHVYGGKPTLISCYYAPLKQLSVQSQMRGWHRWGNISRGLKAAQRIWTCSGV